MYSLNKNVKDKCTLLESVHCLHNGNENLKKYYVLVEMEILLHVTNMCGI